MSWAQHAHPWGRWDALALGTCFAARSRYLVGAGCEDCCEPADHGTGAARGAEVAEPRRFAQHKTLPCWSSFPFCTNQFNSSFLSKFALYSKQELTKNSPNIELVYHGVFIDSGCYI
jgi:hypothetical protein